LLGDERGFALVLALGVTVVLGMMMVTVVESTSANSRTTAMQGARLGAGSLAEAGINDAASVLNVPSRNALDPNVFCPDGQVSPCPVTDTLPGGSVTYTAILTGSTWKVTSVGSVRNPTGVNAPSLKWTMTATIEVKATLTQPLNNPAWNYVYATHAPTPGVCDEIIQQSVTVSSPLFVSGNLCLQNTAVIAAGPLDVKGSLTLSQPANAVGSLAAKIGDAHIAGGCQWKNNPFHNPCQGAVDNVFASVLDTTPTSISPPVADWNDWYLNASPGPYFPCTTVSGTPPTFDNPVAAASASDATKLTYMNDNAGTFNLTPASSYSCKTATGELSWDNTQKLLTVSGTIFIDGSAYINNGAVNQYSGQATLYLRGTFLMKNSTLCGNLNVLKTACDTLGWNPNARLLCVVANGNGSLAQDSQVSGGDSAQFVSASFQGGVFGTNNVQIDTTSSIDGPIVGLSVMLGQSVTTSFPTITTVPVGMPSNPTIYAQPQPPSNYTG
jgi:hypothetical protein